MQYKQHNYSNSTHLHHCDGRINLWWKRNLDFVSHPVDTGKQHIQ